MKLQVLIWSRSAYARNLHWSAVKRSCKASPEIDSIIRVDHAGELGADRIYAGQMAVLGHTKVGPTIQHMWDQEKVHKATFERLITKYRVRPTAFVPIWNVAGFVLGAGTALLGEKAAMACTVAVESVIVEHYNDQLRTLTADPEKNKELLQVIQKFRDEEQEHHDCGIDHGAEQAPFYQALSQVIKVGCKTAIAISKGSLFVRWKPKQLYSRSYCTSTNAKPNHKWDLYCGVCLERKPVILKPLNGFEKKFFETMKEAESEGSYKSDHELRHERDLRNAKLARTKPTEMDAGAVATQTALDFEEASNKEFDEFRFPSSESHSADSDIKSLDRKLDRHLLYLVKDNVGKNNLWMLPQGIRKDGETLRETAERVLRESCGENLKAAILGNAPWGFYKFTYPKKANKDAVGAKVFFFKAIYLSGRPQGELDFQWASRSELEKLFNHRKYLNSVEMFLIDEEDESVEPEKQSEKS